MSNFFKKTKESFDTLRRKGNTGQIDQRSIPEFQQHNPNESVNTSTTMSGTIIQNTLNYNQNVQTGKQLLTKAVENDEQEQYPTAIHYYIQGLEALINAMKYGNDLQKQQLKQQVGLYMSRTEELKQKISMNQSQQPTDNPPNPTSGAPEQQSNRAPSPQFSEVPIPEFSRTSSSDQVEVPEFRMSNLEIPVSFPVTAPQPPKSPQPEAESTSPQTRKENSDFLTSGKDIERDSENQRDDLRQLPSLTHQQLEDRKKKLRLRKALFGEKQLKLSQLEEELDQKKTELYKLQIALN